MKRQLYVGAVAPSAERFRPLSENEPRGSRLFKARGGLWTSTYLGPRHGSDWVRWSLEEQFNVPPGGFWRSWLLHPARDARVYVVDSLDDLTRLVERYGNRVPAEDASIAFLDERYPNWHAIAADGWDGVRLTERGQWRTRLSQPVNLYGWDCESVHWFRWAFTRVEDLGDVAYALPEDDADQETAGW